jgi:CrcB protein
VSTPDVNGSSSRPFLDRLLRAIGRDDALPIDPDLDLDDPGAPSPTHRPAGAPVRRSDSAVLAAIGVGGFFGALARYEVAVTFPVRSGGFPLTTFGINTSGALAIGLILTVIVERLPPNRFLRPLTCVGFLGAWTTVSTFATESAVLIKDGHALTALAYILATVLAGLSATAVGIAVARRAVVTP